jgi:hypothetical protein
MFRKILKNPQILNLFLALIILFTLLIVLQFFGLYEGLETDIIIDDSIDSKNTKGKSESIITTNQIPLMPPIPRGYPQGLPQDIIQPNIPVT